MGRIIDQSRVESFYSDECGGSVEGAEAGSVAGLFYGQATTHAEDESLIRSVISDGGHDTNEVKVTSLLVDGVAKLVMQSQGISQGGHGRYSK